MTDTQLPHASSNWPLHAYLTTVLRAWKGLGVSALAGMLMAVLVLILETPQYASSGSFFSTPPDVGRTGLASIAGQFGLALASSNNSVSPEFYSRLLVSPVILRSIARDSFEVREKSGRRVSFLDLYHVPGKTRELRVANGIDLLGTVLRVTVVKQTGVVEFKVTTPWPSVSLQVADALVQRVNEYNKTIRQSQASDERRFIQGRLEVALDSLRQAEDRLNKFVVANRQLGASPELSLERDRLAREVAVRQSVYVTLAQSLEEVRIREVRDTPVITMVESPVLAEARVPRSVPVYLLLGLSAGCSLWLLYLYVSGLLRNRVRGLDHDADAFFDEVERVLARVRWSNRT